MKEIPLTQGKVALVDDEDFEYLSQWKWYARKSNRNIYAVRVKCIGAERITFRMHNEVMKGTGVDHIDHDGLNNQKSNLRFCTLSQNAMNRRKQENRTSIYKGVYFNKRKRKWVASIRVDSKLRFLGLFSSEVDAALAYNNKAVEVFGEFANLNIIDK